jgi:hypothetical protein
MSDTAEIGRYLRNGAKVAGLAFGQKKQLVEEMECGRRRLMDTCDDDELRYPRQSCLQSSNGIRLTLLATANSLTYEITS